MSSERPSGAPTPAAEAAGPSSQAPSKGDLALLVRQRGVALIDALERHLPGSAAHADAVGAYAFAAAVELEHDRAHAELIREVAKLHEIGKVYVAADALAKPRNELTPEEAAQLDRHHESAAMLLRGAGLPEEVCEWVLRTGERFDGGGGEGSHAGEAIPLEARIVRTACACDTVLSDPGLTAPDAGADERRERGIEQLRSRAGEELDPRVVDALARVIDRTASSAG